MKHHVAYLRYVLRHKRYVFVACRALRVPIWQAVLHDWTKFLPSEWTPYARYFYTQPSPGERVAGVADNAPFEGVVIATRPSRDVPGKVDCLIGEDGERKPWWAWHYEVSERVELKAAFDRAWNAHQKRNRHHWQYWLLTFDHGGTEVLEMPESDVREMVADWIGAGRALGKPDVRGWYEANKDKMHLHPATRARVEELLAEWAR